MKTLYELLEVSETASNEVIEKAYRVLAKRYHPDLQPVEKKQEAEEKMKKINNAYSILSDINQRANYDQELKEKREREEQAKIQKAERKIYEQQSQENNQDANMQEQVYEPEEVSETIYVDPKQENKIRRKLERQIKEKYQEAYDDYYRKMGYKVPTRWTWKKVRDLGITILIMIVIAILLWVIPPTHRILVDLYENNVFIQTLVNVIGGIFKVLGDTVKKMFHLS